MPRVPYGEIESVRPFRKRTRKFAMRRRRPTAKSNQRAIKKLQRIFELKDFTLYTGPSAILNTAWLIPGPVNLIPVGTTSNTRVGDRITMTSIQWMGELRSNGAGTSNQTVRFIIVVDRQSNGIGLTSAEVQNQLIQQQSPGLASGFLSPFDTSAVTRPGRFKVLHNEIIQLNQNFATSAYNITVKGKRKMNMEAKWDADISATVPVTNAIYPLFISDQATNGPSEEISFKIIYKDA